MRRCALAAAVWLLTSVFSVARPDEPGRFDWDQWRQLPVQEGGRQKPLDTLARESLRRMSHRAHAADPRSGQRLDATTLYLAMLFDWDGWDRPATGDESLDEQNYFRAHPPDHWDQMPLLRVTSPPLLALLGMLRGQTRITPLELSRAKIKPPGAAEETPFLAWARTLRDRQPLVLMPFEQQSLELADGFWTYQRLRMGRQLQLLPIQGSEQQHWISLAELLSADWDDTADPTGLIRQAVGQFLAARAAYLAGSADEFNRASAASIAAFRQLGPQLGPYPSANRIRCETAYNRWAPLRVGWLASLAAVMLLLGAGSRRRRFYAAAWLAALVSLSAILAGFAIRVVIAGRAPVANMYESVVYAALGTLLLGMVFEGFSRRRLALLAAAALTTLGLLLADVFPAVLDPSVRPLPAELRSNFWLITHVMIITLSYAAFAVALGTGNLFLGRELAGAHDATVSDELTTITYRAVQLGVLLLAAGIVLGGVWADYSWGRFWGWDPKEVWALIALLAYLAVLHARQAGWIGSFGLAASAVACFSLVVMAWYGVNFVLGAGLHSYGFGGGGKAYVLSAIVVQLLFVAAAGGKKLTAH